MKNSNLAVLLTCYNRRDSTLACLGSLYAQNLDLDVYLVDDNSSDGTSEAVKTAYPSINLLSGTGNLFWVGGMRLAFGEAMRNNYDYYLWLNDDTLLETDALNKLIFTHNELNNRGITDSIIIGSTRDRLTGKPTYGGMQQSKLWYSNKYEFIEPCSEPKECETMNGNCVLIPASVAAKVGNIDAAFRHSLGDIDYGLRARKLNCHLIIAPGYVGTCSHNSIKGSWADKSLPIHQRLRKVFQPKAFPIQAWTVFNKRHSGTFWYLYWMLPYVRSVIGYKDLNASWFCDDNQQDSLQSQ